MEKMVESLLWSDPSRKKGVNVSPRGTGVLFGRDVANTFLTAEKLKYIVRGHEPVEEGVKEMDCGDGMRVITVFSAANYPNEEGHNVGALLHLLSDGGHDSITFNYKEQKEGILDSLFSWVGMTEKSLQSIVSAAPPDDKLRIYINEKKFRLLKAFSAVEKDGLVSKEDWASVMRKSMDLGRVGWAELQPRIAPTTVPGGDYINWREYLIENTTDIRTRLDDEEKMGKTVDWMDKMLVIFEFLDLGRNGSVGLQEFIAGTRLLNRYHLPKIRQITDPVELFSRFDDDHSGRITLDEIQDHLSHSHIVVKMKKFVGKQQLKTVAKNTDMLKLAFEFMDKAGSGTITFEEWQAGINLLNKKLHRNEIVYDAKELFMMMDIDGSGEIDIEEFKDLFGSL
jgi:Ca2+-binding EF-hand superfamily protein